ncbi:MAG: CinA family protein [Moraxellaceae bacterium]|nr:MAG: CinA family protein [Moraxellaceae bacterium]
MSAINQFALSKLIGEKLHQRKWCVATAESCTGGQVAAAITEVAGSSQWFEYGIVSYANSAKEKLLHVNPQAILAHGAVSDSVVREMVSGILQLSGANIVVAVSGIAGPGGGTPEKPVGTVCFGWGLATGERDFKTMLFSGDRKQIQQQATIEALKGLLPYLN